MTRALQAIVYAAASAFTLLGIACCVALVTVAAGGEG